MKLHSLSQWLYKHSTGWIALIGLALFMVFGAAVLPGQSAQAAAYSAETGTPDTSFFYTPAELAGMAEAYGAQGRQAYVHARFTFDLIYPLVYTFFLAAAVSWLMKKLALQESPWRLLNLLPLAAMLLDFLENICAARVMAIYPQEQPAAALLASIFTPLKWLGVVGSFVLLAIVGGMMLWRRIRKK